LGGLLPTPHRKPNASRTSLKVQQTWCSVDRDLVNVVILVDVVVNLVILAGFSET